MPGLVNAGFSRFQPGTHLHPHRGELPGVLRCHLPLQVPAGCVGMRFGGETCTSRSSMACSARSGPPPRWRG